MKTVKVILTFLWGLPQNLLALVFFFLLLVEFPGKTYKEAFVIRMNWKGAITLGNFIFVCREWYDREDILQHEYGHVRQSYILGPLYLIVIGLPSLLWAALHTHIAAGKPYEWFYTEAWADKLSH